MKGVDSLTSPEITKTLPMTPKPKLALYSVSSYGEQQYVLVLIHIVVHHNYIHCTMLV